MSGVGHSHQKKIEKFKKLHPDGRKEYAKAKRQAKILKRKKKLELKRSKREQKS